MAKAAAKAKEKPKAYTRKRVAIGLDHVIRGETLIEEGRVPGRGIEYADTRTAGLILRVTPTASTFFLKTERATIRLGEANRITVDQARDQATLARISLKSGRDEDEPAQEAETEQRFAVAIVFGGRPDVVLTPERGVPAEEAVRVFQAFVTGAAAIGGRPAMIPLQAA